MPVLGRVATAMATPFTSDGDLDHAGIQTMARHLVDTGTDCVVVNGTTGESPTTSPDEKLTILRLVREAVGGDALVMAGTGTYDTRDTIASTEAATAAGADAILVVTPYYNRPSQAGLLAHFTAVAAATDRPVVLYDVPSRTNCELELATITELADIRNVVAIKDAVANLGKTAEIVAATADATGGFEVYCGADEVNLPMLAVGAVGFVSVSAHLAGAQLQAMTAAFLSGEVATAMAMHNRLMPLHRSLFVEPSPAPLKGALRALGIPAGPVRGPLIDASEATVKTVLDALDHAGIAR